MAPIGAVRLTGRRGRLRGLCGDFVLVWLSVSSKRSGNIFLLCRWATIALTAALAARCDAAVWTCRAFAELRGFAAERGASPLSIASQRLARCHHPEEIWPEFDVKIPFYLRFRTGGVMLCSFKVF